MVSMQSCVVQCFLIMQSEATVQVYSRNLARCELLTINACLQVIPGMNSLAVDLLQQLLSYPPEQRITARQALDHPYLSGIRPRSPLAVSTLPPESLPTDVAQPADSAHDSACHSANDSAHAPARESAHESAHESPSLPPAVRALRLTDMCRSHSDPGLCRQRQSSEGRRPVEETAEPGETEHKAAQTQGDEKQRSRPRQAHTERMTTRCC